MSSLLEVQLERLAEAFPEPDGDARRRAREAALAALPRRRAHARGYGRVWDRSVSRGAVREVLSGGRGRRRLVLLVGVVLVLGIGGATALAYKYVGPSAGFTAGVSAFEELPPAQWPASMTRVGLVNSARRVGLAPQEAERRLRLLRSDTKQGDLYAFGGPNGTICMFLTRHFGDCLEAEHAPGSPGVSVLLSPGRYPDEDAAVVGVVADNVMHVTVVANGRDIPAEIRNNAVYLDVPGVVSGHAVSVRVTYQDGTVKTFDLLNP